MKLLVLVSLGILQIISAENVIYHLEPKDYYRMPHKNHLDRMTPCRGLPGGVYCTALADIVSDKPSELLDMMKGYSAHYTTHFNYTNIKYGLCITKTCKKFYNGDNSQAALWNTTEACLNDSFTREYDLKVRVTDLECDHDDRKFVLNFVDKVILVTLGLIFSLNVIGSIYDFARDESKPGDKFLLFFAIRTGWRQLVSSKQPKDPRHASLVCLNGMRAILSLLVILGHVLMPTINAVYNPEEFESLYKPTIVHFLHNGHMLTGIFFTISGFLLAYNMEVQAEKKKITWTHLLKATRSRWLRLSPTNFVMLMVTIVWIKFLPIGPLFKEYLQWESEDCRQYWFYNVFYLTNLIDFSMCNLQVWFLASDFQLHFYCLAILVLSPSKRVRNWALLALGLAGVIWPAYLIYAHDLDGNFLSTPTTHNTYYTSSVTFNRIFKPAIPNAPIFVIGMAFGFLVYSMQKNNITTRNFRKYRVAYWAVIVSTFLTVITGKIFYLDAPRPSLLVRVLYTPIVKPIFAVLVNLIILGTVCKCDDLIRGILEWPKWEFLQKVSYCMFLAHMFVMRYSGGTRDSLVHYTMYSNVHELFAYVSITILLAIFLHILVELPFAGLVDHILNPGKSSKSDDAKDVKEPIYETESTDNKTD